MLDESIVKTARRIFMNSWHGLGGWTPWNGMAVLLAAVFFRAALSALGLEPPNSLSSDAPTEGVHGHRPGLKYSSLLPLRSQVDEARRRSNPGIPPPHLYAGLG